jgi:hypothetical protein
MEAQAPIKLSEASRHGTIENDISVGSRFPFPYPHACSRHGFAASASLAFPNGKGVDRRYVLQRIATARKENVVVLCREAQQ